MSTCRFQCFILVSLFFILSKPTDSFASNQCYLFIIAPENQIQTLDQIAKPLLNSFVNTISSLPPEGLSNQQQKDFCQFEITLVSKQNQFSLQITSVNGTPLNAVINLGGTSPNHIKSGILRAIIQSLPEKKAKICRQYAEILPAHCESEKTIAVLYDASNENNDNVNLDESRKLVWEEIDQLLNEVEFLTPEGSRKKVTELNNIGSKLDSEKVNGAISFQIILNREKKKTQLWIGMMDAQIKLNAFQFRNDNWKQVGSYTTKIFRRPIRKWTKDQDVLKSQYQFAVKKLLNKWSTSDIQKMMNKLKQ